jgi:hypothetical protein
MQKELYCKALVFASGGGRLARDWIAGSAALSDSNPELLTLSLTYDGAKADVMRFFFFVNEGRDNGAEQSATKADLVASDPGADERREESAVVLRCFLYDAAKAASFCEGSLSPWLEVHLYRVAEMVMIPKDFMRDCIALVQEENELLRKKLCIIDHPISDQ